MRQPVATAADTREATVQGDLFNPLRSGKPGSGGGAERTRCTDRDSGQEIAYGKTVWYAVSSKRPGVILIRATGYDAVIATYQFDPQSLKPIAIGCRNSAGDEQNAALAVDSSRIFLVQIGGVDTGRGPGSGALQASFQFFPDRDRDQVPDQLDRCDNQPGAMDAGGCLPALRATTQLGFDLTRTRTTVRRFVVTNVTRGSRVEARCTRKCSVRQVAMAGRAGEVALSRFVDRSFPVGARIEIRVTHRRVPRLQSRYRFGAVGVYTRFVIRPGRLPKRTDGCLLPGKRQPRKRCR